MASNTLQQRRPARDHNQPPLDPGREIQDSDHGMAQKQRLSPWRPWIADSRVYRRFSPKSSAICVAISVSMLLIMTGAGPSATGIYVENPSMITFAVGLEQKGTPLFRQLSDFDFNMDLKPDFGEIIHDLDSKRYEEYRSELLSDMNHERIRLEFYFDEELEYVEQKCRRVNWFSKTYPTCNAFHELPPVFDLRKEKDYKVTYLSSGYYRDAFRYEKHTDAEEFVLKPLRLKTKMIFNFRDFAMVQKEAVIMEQLSASPNILDMYGYCGTSVVLEAMAGVVDSKMMTGDGYASRKELDRLDDVYPANNLTAMEKLQIALEMAESLADIHGYKGGEIVHEDVYPEQWLVARDGAVKLNDFNNAGISLWDDATQTYCTRQAEYNGMYHAPEEYNGYGILDHGVDAYSYGNNIYILLTGLWPFYDTIEEWKVREMLVEGKKPYIDPRYRTRSYIEGKLIEIMERCWKERTKRADMFQIVHFLREVKSIATKG